MPAALNRPSLRSRLVLYPLMTALLLSLTGCLTFESIIKLKRDGSGTVEQTFIFTSEMLRMALLFGGDDGGPVELCDQEELAEQAASMGEGVSLLSSEAIDDGDAIGCRAIFAFDDINTLNVSFNPEDQMPGGMAAEEPDAETLDEETENVDFISFRFDPGRPAALTVTMDQDPGNDEASAEEESSFDAAEIDSTMKRQQMQMMREMFKGARLAILLEIEGEIKETDASFRDGNRITLMEMDFDKLLEDEESLEKLADADPQNTDEMKALMEDIEGVKLETKEMFTVTF